ncbi:MAG: NAD(P)H-dependent glycerol-3-phosphate dehydrogenase [Candidatus Omnitrophota bacterium]
MEMIKRISILGDGGWGTALAVLLAAKGFSLRMWSVSQEYAATMARQRVNAKFLPGVRLPDNIQISADLADVVSFGELLVVAVPSQYLRSALRRLDTRGSVLRGKHILSVVKGIEEKTLMRMSEVIKDVWGGVCVSVLSGPTIAYEVARGVPTTAVAASSLARERALLQDVFMTKRFRVYAGSDVIGVELGGSVKNVIAIACGICDGLGFGANTKAALLARGLAEMGRLARAKGARLQTIYGISGLGDLATTCISRHSRNRGLGERIGRGERLKDIMANMQMVAEGVPTAKSVYRMGNICRVEMPITREVYNVLYKHKNPLRAVDDLMLRKKRRETV